MPSIDLNEFHLQKETLLQHEQNLVIKQNLVLTPTTLKNLKKILYAIAENRNILLMGDAGVGKNALIYYINYLRNLPSVRYSFNQDTQAEDVVGSFHMHSNSFSWLDGPILEAMKHGYCFIADEMNLCSPHILKRFLYLFEQRKLLILEKDSSMIQAHTRFHVIVTQNPSMGFEDRKELPMQIARNFTTIYIEPYSLEEEVLIIKNLFPQFNKKFIQDIIESQRRIQLEMYKMQLAQNDFEHYLFNLRTLKRFFNILEYFINQKKINLKDISLAHPIIIQQLFIFYINIFHLQEDRNKCVNLLKEVLNIDINLNDKKWNFNLVKNFTEPLFKERSIIIHKNFPPIQKRLYDLSKIETIIQMNHNLLLEAPEDINVLSYIETLLILPQYKNQNTVHIQLYEGIQTSELIGSLKPITNKENSQKLTWVDGPLTKGLKEEKWIILDNVEAAGGDFVEKLNMLLDDANSLILPKECNSQTIVKKQGNARIIAIKYFRTSRRGRTISRAFRNRFMSYVIDSLTPEDIQESIFLYSEYLFEPKILENLQEILNKLFLFHFEVIQIMNDDSTFFTESNLLNVLDHIHSWLTSKNISILIYQAIDLYYFSSISNFELQEKIKSLWEKISQDLSLDLISKKITANLNKALQKKKPLKNKVTQYMNWDPKKHFRNPNTGRAKYHLRGKKLKKGLRINTLETGGSTKEGPDAWYGKDTLGNKGIGEPQGGGGAWGYKTEEVIENFLLNYKPKLDYNLNVSLEDYYQLLNPVLNDIKLDMDNILNDKKNYDIIPKNYGKKINVNKYLKLISNYHKNTTSNKVFDYKKKINPNNNLQSMEFILLINKGRRIFNFEYSILTIIALQSLVEILLDESMGLKIFGYSNTGGFYNKFNFEEYTSKYHMSNNIDKEKKEIFHYISTNWHNDTPEEYLAIEHIEEYFSKNAKLKVVVIFSDFRGYRTKAHFDDDLLKKETILYQNLVEEKEKKNIIFLALQIGNRNLAEYLFKYYIHIHHENYLKSPLLLVEKIKYLIKTYAS